MNYVYIRSEPGLYTVGFYDPKGKWQPDSDHTDREAAARRAHWLNGGAGDRSALAGLANLAHRKLTGLADKISGGTVPAAAIAMDLRLTATDLRREILEAVECGEGGVP